MNEALINDLKEFIATTVGASVAQQLAGQTLILRQEMHAMESRLSKRIDALDIKIDARADEILVAVAETMHAHIEHTDERLDDHESRLTDLEQAAA